MKSIPYIDDMKIWTEAFKFFVPIRVRFSETDMFGHVNNVSPFIYFEEARTEFLKSVGLFDNQNDTYAIPVAADLQCDYHQQMFFGDSLKLYVKINHVGNTSVDMHYMGINQHEQVCITGRGRLVYVNPKTGKPVKIEEELKESLLLA
ncbi:acyl-CoA thioesterase [Virgibacillus flavescens]|uniref:acyl-CoA thioesterase n=1 Tax=Virgibacillus flavescens TaxID=1611422 RepID=UPI003D3503FB